MSEITALRVSPGKAPQRITLEPTDAALREIIGAETKRLWPFSHPFVCLVLPRDQENHVDLAPNRNLWSRHNQLIDTFWGDTIIVGRTRENQYISLTDDAITFFSSKYRTPEGFPFTMYPEHQAFDRDLTIVFEGNRITDNSTFECSTGGLWLEYHADANTVIGIARENRQSRTNLREVIGIIGGTNFWPDFRSLRHTYTHDVQHRLAMGNHARDAINSDSRYYNDHLRSRLPHDVLFIPNGDIADLTEHIVTGADAMTLRAQAMRTFCQDETTETSEPGTLFELLTHNDFFNSATSSNG